MSKTVRNVNPRFGINDKSDIDQNDGRIKGKNKVVDGYFDSGSVFSPIVKSDGHKVIQSGIEDSRTSKKDRHKIKAQRKKSMRQKTKQMISHNYMDDDFDEFELD